MMRFAALIALCLSVVAALPTTEHTHFKRDGNITLTPLQLVATTSACAAIAANISSASAVYAPGTPQYLVDIAHYSLVNTQLSICSVEPGTNADVAKVLTIIGKFRAPFNVVGGGHQTFLGASSSPGIQISMRRFSSTVYNAGAGTATIGIGQTWDTVYQALDQYNVAVLGGRVAGVGVAGYSLGGGYGWRSNQVGLTIDTVVSWTLVTPDGQIRTVSSTDTELGYFLKGGFNNVGIVTDITLKTQKSTTVYAGLQVFLNDKVNAVLNASANFDAQNTDLRAQMLVDYTAVAGVLRPILLILFFDGDYAAAYPNGDGPFKELLAIPGVLPTSAAFKQQRFAAFVSGIPSQLAGGQRISYSSISVPRITVNLTNEMQKIGNDYSVAFLANTGVLFNINPEPFVNKYFSYSDGNALYPHSASDVQKPIEINLAWLSPTADSYMINLAKTIASRLTAVAVAEGQKPGLLYPNYALADTPLSQMYGSNVARGQQIAAKYDPSKVMTLAGGFKFQ